MSTRRVPAALHRELSEYASLLRALRTRDTLDVTKHLTKPSKDDEILSDDAKSFRSRSRESEGPSRKKQIPRDHWTRWPLMLNDVLEPEWTLEDEVAVVASHALRANVNPFVSSAADSEEPEDDLVILDMQPEDDDPDHPYYVPSLTFIISDFLSAILGQLALLTPPRPGSMQNRIEPLNWHAVIDAVVSLGNPEYSNPEVLRNVVKRLEAIYSPSLEDGASTTHRFIDRAEQIVAFDDQRHQQQEKLLADLFDQASPSTSVYPAESSSTKRAQVVTEDDKEESEFVVRRKQIAKGKRRGDNDGVSNAVRRPRRSSRINSNNQDISSRSTSPRGQTQDNTRRD